MMKNNSNFHLRGFDTSNIIASEAMRYPTPSNLNLLWSFGFLMLVYLLIQIITGILLAIHYVPTIAGAYDSVNHIMYEVHNGSIIRYMHSNGASMFLLCVYIHISKAIYYFSYLPPRVAVWVTGVVLFLLICATAFTGYVLPWGQMSLWGATVIINFFTAIPIYGAAITKWIIGGHAIATATLQRFFIFHVITPFIILILSGVHIYLLHKVGSSNPTIFGESEPIPFYPYFFLKDLQVLSVSLIVYVLFVCYAPDILGHPDNYIQANALVTPKHIVPEWYFLPFYAILRSIPSKMGGVLAMLFSILVWFVIPFYKTSREKMMKSLPVYHIFVWFFFCDFLALGWIGSQPVDEPFIMLGQAFTIYYFVFFLIIIPFYPYIDTHFFAPILSFLRNLLTKKQLLVTFPVLNKCNVEDQYIFHNYFFIKTVLRNLKETLNKFLRFLKLSRCEKFVTFFFETIILICFKYASYAVKRASRSRRVLKLHFKIPTKLPYKPIQTYGGFSKMTSLEREKACPSLNRRVPFVARRAPGIFAFFNTITLVQEYVYCPFLHFPEYLFCITSLFLVLWVYINPRLEIKKFTFYMYLSFFLALGLRFYINAGLFQFVQISETCYEETVFVNGRTTMNFMQGFFEGAIQTFLYFLSTIFLMLFMTSDRAQTYYDNSVQKLAIFYLFFSLCTIGLSLLITCHHVIYAFGIFELVSFTLLFITSRFIKSSEQIGGVFMYFFMAMLGTLFFLIFALSYNLTFGTYVFIDKTITQLFIDAFDNTKNSLHRGTAIVALISLICFFAIKLGFFPFFFWVRAVYIKIPYIVLIYLNAIAKPIYFFVFLKFFKHLTPVVANFQNGVTFLLAILLVCSLFVSIVFLVRETRIKGVFSYLSVISNIFLLAPFCSLASYSSFLMLNTVFFFVIFYSLITFYLLYVFTTISVVDSRRSKVHTVFFQEISYISDLVLVNQTSIPCKATFLILIFSAMALPPFPIFFAKIFLFILLFYLNAPIILALFFLSSIFSIFYYKRLIKIFVFDKNSRGLQVPLEIVEHDKYFHLFFFLTSIFIFVFFIAPMLFPFIGIFFGML